MKRMSERQPSEADQEGPVHQPDWWHRDHPTFHALSGFFAGMLFVTAVPGGFAALLRWMLPFDAAERYFPLVALAAILPVALVAYRPTRRFGTYMWIGMALTALVVLGITSIVLYVMILTDR